MSGIKGSQIRNETITGTQINDDSLTGDDINESTLKVTFITDLDADTKIQVEESSDEDKIRFDVAGSEAVIIDSNGRLGINTSSPDYKLDVSGNIGFNEYLYHNGDSDTNIRFENNQITLTAGGQSTLFDSGGDFSLTGSITTQMLRSDSGIEIDAANGNIVFKDNGTTRMVIENGGNIGIGSLVTNPSYHLHLKKNTTSPMIYIDNIATDNTDFIYARSSLDLDPDSGSYLLRWQDNGFDTIYSVRGNGSGGSTVSTSFTAGHDTVLKISENLLPGMIVESTGEVWYKPTDKTFETALPKCRLCSDEKSKKVYGVIGGIPNVADNNSKAAKESGGSIINGYLQSPAFPSYGKKAGVSEDEVHLNLMSLGEGVIWITNINGNISNGDLICSSNILGHGQLQDDDIMRSMTVSKCTENIDWDNITDTINHNGVNYKRYLASCTFHCG